MTTRQHDNVMPLDGNAAAGLLSEFFALDMTAAALTCGGCGSVAEVGEARVYGGRMGAIFRCCHCNNVVIRLVRASDGYWLDMQGTRRLFCAGVSS